MNIKYYIVRNQDINNDGRKEDLIFKYRGDQFLGALPLKDYVDIDDYFSKIPVIPQKYYVVYTFHDYNRDNVKDHIVHIFSGNSNKYILSVPINEFMSNAKAYKEYIKYKNNSNIYNEELSKQYRGGKRKKGGNPDQLQRMHVNQQPVEYVLHKPNNLPLNNKKSLNDMEKQELQELREQIKEMQKSQKNQKSLQMNQQLEEMQQMQQMQQPVAHNVQEPYRVANGNTDLDEFKFAALRGAGTTLGASIMNSVFDMFSGE